MNTPDPLEIRFRAMLPEDYQESYEEVQPVSMGSAGLRFGADGQVAWNEMWDTFCDLAMAGGPPHKGSLLEPASRAAIDAQPERYAGVVEQIRRGVKMISGLDVEPAPAPGWVRVTCESDAMAGWLLRAIVMENVTARADGPALDLPASPDYRIEKEIKNVVTVMAKTCHYWQEHMSWREQLAIGRLLETMAEESPLVVPAPSDRRGWRGVECPDVRAAVWMMRMMVASNVLSRREGTVLFLPVNPDQDPGGERVAGALARVQSLARSRRIL